MNRARKFLALPPQLRLLLVRAATWFGVAGIGLRLLPFKRMQGVMSTLARPKAARRRNNHAGPAIDNVIWAIEAVSRALPLKDTCLIQALTAQVMLGRLGYSADIQIGVTRDADGKFTAHAWVERDGEILLGASGTNYVPLYSWGGDPL